MSTLTVSLSEEIADWAQAEAQTKGLSYPAKFIDQLLREAKARCEEETERAETELETLLLEALDAGEGERVDAQWWVDFRAEMEDKLKQQRQNGTPRS